MTQPTVDTDTIEAAGEVAEQPSPGILAAQITGAHGVSGNVRVRLIGSNAEVSAEALRNTRVLTARKDDGTERTLTLSSLRKQVQAKGAWIASFKEISDRVEAEVLYSFSLYVPETALPALPEGEYYVDQLLGMAVVTDTDKPLGDLTEILHSPANDVYVTSSGVMVPAVAAFIKSVDTVARRIVVIEMPGLLDA